jgi:hypothetical protein
MDRRLGVHAERLARRREADAPRMTLEQGNPGLPLESGYLP